MNPASVAYGPDGLLPAVVQDAATGRVLMVAYMNEAALRRTLETNRVTFWSRSRNELWEKGATSGNTLELVTIAPDCDGDALLVAVRPAGPACHTGAESCFDADPAGTGFARLETLWAVISARAAARPEGSYTAALVAGGIDAVARKVIEEAGEVVLAAKDHAGGGPADRVDEEAADLLYHLLVLLAERGLGPAGFLGVLDERAGRSRPAS